MQQISHQPEFSIPLQKHAPQRTEPAHIGTYALPGTGRRAAHIAGYALAGRPEARGRLTGTVAVLAVSRSRSHDSAKRGKTPPIETGSFLSSG